MIAALCRLYRCSRDPRYLDAAKRAQGFLENSLCDQDTLYVSIRGGKLGARGFLDDYASYIFALLSLYDATLERTFLRRAVQFIRETVAQYHDSDHGGFYLSGTENEALLFHPKECYDGAIPSGNSLLAYVLVRDECIAAGSGYGEHSEQTACLYVRRSRNDILPDIPCF